STSGPIEGPQTRTATAAVRAATGRRRTYVAVLSETADDDDVHELDDLVTRVGRKARAQRQLPAVVSPEHVRLAETDLGFPLPPLLTALYLRVADGGFGPGSDVPIPGYDAAFIYPLAKAVDAHRRHRTPDPGVPYAPWPEGVLPLLFWGCFAEAAIDC